MFMLHLAPGGKCTFQGTARRKLRVHPPSESATKNKNAPLPCCLRYGREEYVKKTKRFKKMLKKGKRTCKKIKKQLSRFHQGH